ncbi:hypothetical protein [Hymenobacter sp. UYCo722]|uniref:hypothetical protein n=1 Tax=Hymenobacter sp. UYCo722 TaxID=3156335 RepID=UPI003397D16F
MEDYAAKMLLKTDAALREYVTGHVQYREAAVLAALDELRRRGQPAAEEAALRPTLEAGAAAQRVADEAAAAKAIAERPAPARNPGEPAEIPADAPALYSPLTIILFSIMSVPIGGILLGINLFRVGQKKALLGLVLFILAYMGAGMGLLALAASQGSSVYVWGLLGLNLLATMVYLQWFWPRYVGTTVYRNRSALVPLAVCLLLVWGAQKLSPALLKQPGKAAPAQQNTPAR